MTYGGSRRPDLAARLRRGQRGLKSRLERPESVLALLRAAHDSLDPESIGKLVVNRAEDVVQGARMWRLCRRSRRTGVRTRVEGRGRDAGTGGDGCRPVGDWARTGICVRRSSERFAGDGAPSAPCSPGHCGAALRRSRALVVMERQAAKQVPQLAPAVGAALGSMLEGPAQALDNALRLRRSEALIGHRRPHAALQLPVPEPGAAP